MRADRDAPQQLLRVGGRRIGHERARLGHEILDDDFLDVPVALVQRTNGEQRLDALGTRLADTDQNAAS